MHVRNVTGSDSLLLPQLHEWKGLKALAGHRLFHTILNEILLRRYAHNVFEKLAKVAAVNSAATGNIFN